MFEQNVQVLKALANGINYFTGEKCKEDSILNDVNIIRTLYDVCDILKDIKPDKISKVAFTCPFDIDEKFEYEDELNMTRIIEKICLLYPNMKKLKHSQITDILVNKKLLERIIDEDGQNKTIATEIALQQGIYNVQRTTAYGKSYSVVVYNPTGQKLVLSLLKNI